MAKYRLLHFNTRANFDSVVSSPEQDNDLWNDLVFIKDTKEIYTHGQFYDCSNNGYSGGDVDNPTEPDTSSKGGIILYDVNVNNANFEDITLSESAANYTQLDICCCTDVGETVFITVYNPDKNIFNVSSSIQESGELIIKSKQYEIFGNSINRVYGLGGMCSVSSNGITTISGNYIGIYKVIGF